MKGLFDRCPDCSGDGCEFCDFEGTAFAWAEIKNRRHDPFVKADERGDDDYYERFSRGKR